jgi:hypothetical protein
MTRAIIVILLEVLDLLLPIADLYAFFVVGLAINAALCLSTCVLQGLWYVTRIPRHWISSRNIWVCTREVRLSISNKASRWPNCHTNIIQYTLVWYGTVGPQERRLPALSFIF